MVTAGESPKSDQLLLMECDFRCPGQQLTSSPNAGCLTFAVPAIASISLRYPFSTTILNFFYFINR